MTRQATRSAEEILATEYLQVRAKILEVAAALDRLDRGAGVAGDDQRLSQIRSALETLLREEPNRAEQVQLIFSRAYLSDWRDEFGV